MDGILEVQRASRPDLPIPEDHPERNGILGDFYAFVKQIKKERDPSLSPNELIAEQWRKAAYFADQHLLSHKQFLTGVSSLLSGETFEYVRKLPKDTPLETVARELANRLVTKDSLADAQHRLDNFERRADESIRSVAQRLKDLIKIASILHPADMRPGIEATTLVQKLKKVIHEKTLRLINQHETEHRQQGLTLPVDELIDIIDDAERRYGRPQKPVALPVSLYNAEINPPFHSASNPAESPTQADLTEMAMLVNNLLTEDIDPECNAKMVKFDKPSALKKIKENYPAFKKYLPPPQTVKAQNLPGTPNSTFTQVKLQRPITPYHEGYTAQNKQDDSHTSSDRQSRSREVSSSANSAAHDYDEQRRARHAARSPSYNRYLRDRSKSATPDSRARALTPTSYLHRKSYDQLQSELAELKKQKAEWYRNRSQSRGRRDQSRNGYNQRTRSGSRPSESSSYRNQAPQAHGSPTSGAQLNLHSHDSSTVMIACPHCGITGHHTPTTCKTVAILRKNDSEN